MFWASLAAGFLVTAPCAAEILVRFPADTDAARASAVVSMVERSTSITARALTAGAKTKGTSATPPAAALAALDLAQKAYQSLETREAERQIEAVWMACLAVAGRGCSDVLFEANLLQGVVSMTLGEEQRAALAFCTAHLHSPARVVDPRDFPPKVTSAFNRACEACSSATPTALEVRTEPSLARLMVDGSLAGPVPRLELGPGTHLVVAERIGYAPAAQLVAVGSSLSGVKPLSFSLAPLDEAIAWQELRGVLAERNADLTEAGLVSLLRRFGADRVLFVEPAPTGREGLELFLGTAGRPGLVEMPGLTSSLTPKGDLGAAFRQALGLAPLPAAAGAAGPSEATASLPPDPDENEFQSEDDEAIEAPAPPSAQGADQRVSAKTVFSSPWFWVSVGLAAAVVGGVVIVTQVGD